MDNTKNTLKTKGFLIRLYSTIKKIPNMLLGRCEFGKEDYSLNIIDMPQDDNEPDFVPVGPEEEKKTKSKKKKNHDQTLLF